jgi:hypothetical protein
MFGSEGPSSGSAGIAWAGSSAGYGVRFKGRLSHSPVSKSAARPCSYGGCGGVEIAAGGIFKKPRFVHHLAMPDKPAGAAKKQLGITMRKLALLAAIVLAATFSTRSDVFAAGAGEMANPNQNTIDLMRDAMTGGPVVQPAAPGAKKRAHHKRRK